MNFLIRTCPNRLSHAQSAIRTFFVHGRTSRQESPDTDSPMRNANLSANLASGNGIQPSVIYGEARISTRAAQGMATDCDIPWRARLSGAAVGGGRNARLKARTIRQQHAGRVECLAGTGIRKADPRCYSSVGPLRRIEARAGLYLSEKAFGEKAFCVRMTREKRIPGGPRPVRTDNLRLLVCLCQKVEMSGDSFASTTEVTSFTIQHIAPTICVVYEGICESFCALRS